MEINTKEGRKFDENKPQYDLMPPRALEGIVDVLTFGANKYAAHEWKTVPNAKTRYMSAAFRHIEAYRQGETTDKESGLHHLYHAMCCLTFISELDYTIELKSELGKLSCPTHEYLVPSEEEQS